MGCGMSDKNEAVRDWARYTSRRGDIPDYQRQVGEWVQSTFGPASLASREERALRVVEEAAEMAQALGLDEEAALRVVRHVFSREPGRLGQEAGGLMNVLAAACESQGVDLWAETLAEHQRIHSPDVIEKCRRKAAEKAAKGVSVVPAHG